MRERHSTAKEENDRSAVVVRLRAAGLRPTRQRVALARLLFLHKENMHLTAETLYADAIKAGFQVSLATVYNTLHQFTEAGLLKQVAVEPGKSYFDTNVSEHQHFFIEEEGRLIDISGPTFGIDGIPPPPKGLSIDRIDVVIRLKRA